MLSVHKNELSAGKIYMNLKVSTCVQRSFDEKGGFRTVKLTAYDKVKTRCVTQGERSLLDFKNILLFLVL